MREYVWFTGLIGIPVGLLAQLTRIPLAVLHTFQETGDSVGFTVFLIDFSDFVTFE